MKSVSVLVLNGYDQDNRVKKIQRSLSKKGLDVTVFCLRDSSSPIRSESVVRVTPYVRPKIFFFKKVVQFWVLLKYTLLTFFYTRDSDIIWCNDLNTLHIGVLSKFFFRNKLVVYDSHELHTDTVWNYNKPIKRYLIKCWEKALASSTDLVVTVSSCISKILTERFNMKVEILPNCLSSIDHSIRTIKYNKSLKMGALGISDKDVVCVFHGGMTPGRGIYEILEIADRSPTWMKFLFIGNGPLDPVIQAKMIENSKIKKIDFVPHQVLLKYLSECDFGFILYDSSCDNHRYCMPNKLFEYTACGLTCVVNDELVEIANLQKQFPVVLTLHHFLNVMSSKEAIKNCVASDNDFESFNSAHDWDGYFDNVYCCMVEQCERDSTLSS